MHQATSKHRRIPGIVARRRSLVGYLVRSFAGSWIALGVAGVGSVARAGEVETLNALYASIQPGQRSDTVLIPVLAKLAAPPASVGTRTKAALLPASSTGFADAAAWAQGAPQVAAIEALKKVSGEQEILKSFAFGQPYGADVTDISAIKEKLYTELGDPPLLAAAKIQYLPALDRLSCLVHVEATRLVQQKKGGEALALMTHWVYFTRSMCDRQFFREVRWGYGELAAALERVRDVMYTDGLGGAPTITQDQLHGLIEKLSVDTPKTAYMNLDRSKLPEGDRLAAEQLISIVFDASGSPDERTFASTMSRLSSAEYPLRLFSEAGKWQSVGSSQAGKTPMLQAAVGAHRDWSSRWLLESWDKQMSKVWDYSTRQAGRYDVMLAAMPDMSVLFGMREIARAELSGVRCAAGVVGTKLGRGSFPPVLSAIRPLWVRQLSDDPFNFDRDRENVPPLAYFVPMKGHTTEPHRMTVVAGGNNFMVTLRDDTFVLYSVGSDNAMNACRRVQNTAQKVEGADYLLWPPMVSLERQHLVDRGQLK